MPKANFYDDEKSVMASARSMVLIAPHDSNEIASLPRAIRANTAGTLAMRCIDDAVDVALNVSAGEVLDVRPLYIRNTGTTATIHGIY